MKPPIVFKHRKYYKMLCNWCSNIIQLRLYKTTKIKQMKDDLQYTRPNVLKKFVKNKLPITPPNIMNEKYEIAFRMCNFDDWGDCPDMHPAVVVRDIKNIKRRKLDVQYVYKLIKVLEEYYDEDFDFNTAKLKLIELSNLKPNTPMFDFICEFVISKNKKV